MLRDLYNLLKLEIGNDNLKKSKFEDKIVEIVEEINELEIMYARQLAEVERWGDITDVSDWRTVELNKIKRIIQSKEKMIETLKSF